jgi:pentatricopeptide repeat protein
MCWVALDRGLRLADKRSFPGERGRWLRERDAVYESIMKRGWNERRQSFVQSYGSQALDAANLIMPMVFFSSPTDPRMLSTLEATMDTLVSDSLVHRYQIGQGANDGLAGSEGTFSMCTFWLVEALARAGRLNDARFIFEKMLSYGNHLGLYSEQIGSCGEALGNFPQGFTHLALISAAFHLDRALNRAGR